MTWEKMEESFFVEKKNDAVFEIRRRSTVLIKSAIF